MDLGWLWHGLGGLAITAVIVVGVLVGNLAWWWVAPMPPLLFLGGWVRERWQHLGDVPAMNAHRWIEAAAWGSAG